MSYIYKVNIVIEDDENNLFYQNMIDKVLENSLRNYPLANIVGASVHDLSPNVCGKCCRCGVWVSNQELENHVDEFSDGCLINGNWWCDLCLPNNHYKYFT